MTFDVRPCADETELLRAFMQIGQYFGSEPDGEWVNRFTDLMPTGRMLAAWDGDEMVGGTGALPFRLSVPGGSVACSGTTVVGVAPTHRRRGVLRVMMQAHLDQAAEQGEPLGALWASEEGIYGRFGFGRAAFAGEIAVPREHVEFDTPLEPRGQIRLVEPDEALEAFPPLWDAAAHIRPGMILRTRGWWERRVIADPAFRRDGGGPMRLALLEQEGAPTGYAIYRHHFGYADGSSTSTVGVVEAVAAEPEAAAAIWRYLLDVDWTAAITAHLVPPDHPLFFLLRQPRRMKYRMGDGLWVRLLDVGKALSERSYPEDGELVLDVRDDLYPSNARRWRLAGGVAEPVAEAADLALDVSALGAAYLGGVSFASLAQGRHVEELKPGAIDRADGIFRHSLHPWCPEIF
jgi:predicted acetyltransferase